MRLVKFLANAGVASRRASDEIIRAGRVTIEGEVVYRPGPRRDRGRPDRRRRRGGHARGRAGRLRDQQAQGRRLDRLGPAAAADRRLADRRPTCGCTRWDGWTSTRRGCCCSPTTASSPTASPTRASRSRAPTRRRSAGRRSPTRRSASCATGVVLEDGRTAPARVKRLGERCARTGSSSEIREGRNRQIKRMCEAVGHKRHGAAADLVRAAAARRARDRGQPQAERTRIRCCSRASPDHPSSR